MTPYCDIIRQRFALVIIGMALPLTGMAQGISNVTIDANGNVLNGSVVNFATGKLEVNGVAVTSGGTSADASTTVKGISKLSTAPVLSTNPIAVGDNDSRMTNARTPTAHAGTHASGGSDPVTPAAIGAPSGSGTSTGANTGDNAVNSLYSGLVSNATHTGDVTGATALTLATAQPAVHTWALAQTFTVAPVFTDQSGSRTALGLGTLSTQSGTFSGTSSGTNTGDQDLSGLVAKTTTVNGHALSANVAVTAADVGAPSGSGTSSGTNTGDQVVPANTTATAHNFLSAYNNSTGAFTKTQPAIPDLSDAGQLATYAAVTPASGITTWWATPTMANLKAALTDETTVGWNLLTLTNPSAISFLEIAADNSVSTKTATQMRTDLLPSQTSNSGKVLSTNGTDVSWIAAAGSGTVTSFSAGTLSPLFTTSVATATTTPALTFVLTNAAAHTVFGNFTASSAAPSYNALGTGVDTALGVNVGSAGAFVTNGGALGTPSGGTLTNATGLPESGVTSLVSDLGLKAPLASPTFTGTVTLPASTSLTTPNIGAATGTSFSLTANSTITLAPAANTAAAGLTLTDTTAAATGSQQYSPYIYQTGQGWKTTATAGSQSVTFRYGVVPVQGTANPTGNYVIESAINGGAFSTPLNYSSAGLLALGGTSSSFPALKRNGAVLNVRLADDSADGGIYASSLRLTNANALDLSTISGDSVVVGSTSRVIFNNNANNANNLIITDAGDVTARKSLGGTAVTFANVPASPVLGMMIPVTDSTTVTWGTTITGGGTNKVLAFYNGTNWTVMAK